MKSIQKFQRLKENTKNYHPGKKVLGTGAFGSVTPAIFGKKTKSKYVIKSSKPHKKKPEAPKETRRRFEQEARILSHIHGGNKICLKQALGSIQIIMPKAPGERLHSAVSKIGSPEEFLVAFYLVAQKLQHLNQSIIHGDIKPDNIYYCPKTWKASIIDFGLSRPKRTVSTGFFGTKHYAAPEMFYPKKVKTVAADVYSLGQSFQDMYFGQRSIGELTTIRLKSLRRKYKNKELYVGLPEALEILLKQMLEEDPTKRITISTVCNQLYAIMQRCNMPKYSEKCIKILTPELNYLTKRIEKIKITDPKKYAPEKYQAWLKGKKIQLGNVLRRCESLYSLACINRKIADKPDLLDNIGKSINSCKLTLNSIIVDTGINAPIHSIGYK